MKCRIYTVQLRQTSQYTAFDSGNGAKKRIKVGAGNYDLKNSSELISTKLQLIFFYYNGNLQKAQRIYIAGPNLNFFWDMMFKTRLLVPFVSFSTMAGKRVK